MNDIVLRERFSRFLLFLIIFPLSFSLLVSVRLVKRTRKFVPFRIEFILNAKATHNEMIDEAKKRAQNLNASFENVELFLNWICVKWIECVVGWKRW